MNLRFPPQLTLIVTNCAHSSSSLASILVAVFDTINHQSLIAGLKTCFVVDGTVLIRPLTILAILSLKLD